MKITKYILAFSLIGAGALAHYHKGEHRHNQDGSISWVFSHGQNGSHGEHIVPHNMVLVGESETYLSHVVYKVPHNFQVLLRVHFDPSTQNVYLRAKKAYPQSTFLLLLDRIHIKYIAQQNSLAGTLLRVTPQGSREVIVPRVHLGRSQFAILYFSELPTNLN